MTRNRSSGWAPGTFLGRIAPEVRAYLLDRGRTRHYAPGERLLHEGGSDTHVALLTSGFAKVSSQVEGIEALLAIRVPGDLVGEGAALTGRPRMASVTASGEVTAALLGRDTFQHVLEYRPEAARQMTALVSERLHWANRRRVDFVAYPADVRLARVLGEIAASCGRIDEDGAIDIRVPLSQSELATMIGAAETTVQKAMRRMRGSGLIRCGYRRVTIVDPGALEKTAAGNGTADRS